MARMKVSSPGPRWNQDTKRLVAAIGLVVLAVLLYLSRPVLPLLSWAAILAYIFQPLIGLLERARVPRGVGALLSILLLIAIVAVGPVLLIPAIAEQVAMIRVDIPNLVNRLLIWGHALLVRYPAIDFFGYHVDLQEIVRQASNYLVVSLPHVELPSVSQVIDYLMRGLQTASGLLGTATTVATGVLNALFATGAAIIFLLTYTFYLAKDGPRLGTWLAELVPVGYRPELERLLESIRQMWAAFFRGQIILSLTIAAVTTIALSIMGMPGALILGILAGILEVVPNLGPLLAMIPAVVLALIQGSLSWDMPNWAFALLTVGVYFSIQQVENALLVPRIMGQSLNLHPMVVLVGIVVGASTAGILGAFLAAPVLGSVRLVARFAHAKLLDLEPFPETEAVVAEVRPGLLSRLAGRLSMAHELWRQRQSVRRKPPSEDVS